MIVGPITHDTAGTVICWGVCSCCRYPIRGGKGTNVPVGNWHGRKGGHRSCSTCGDRGRGRGGGGRGCVGGSCACTAVRGVVYAEPVGVKAADVADFIGGEFTPKVATLCTAIPSLGKGCPVCCGRANVEWGCGISWKGRTRWRQCCYTIGPIAKDIQFNSVCICCPIRCKREEILGTRAYCNTTVNNLLEGKGRVCGEPSWASCACDSKSPPRVIR